MKWWRRVDPGIAVALALCLLAIWPFLSRPGLPRETDAELHVFRTAELSRLLQDGAVYPRWAPNFYFGYGYPIFNFYAPLTYYLGAGLMMIFGISVVSAVKAVFVLGLLAAGVGMYILVKRWWGARPALLAAAVYLYAPYIHYVDPYARGVLAESFSFGLFPWVLWAFSRLLDYVQASRGEQRALFSGRRLVLAAGLLAALICTHNLMAMVLTAIIAAWVCWQMLLLWYAHRSIRSISHAWPLVLALITGVALAAFFWLPVALERETVQLANLLGDGGHFDFRNHFLSLPELLSPTLQLDLGATEPRYLFNLGLAQWLLGLLGVASLLRREATGRRQGALFALLALVLLSLTLPLSSWFWQRVPLMPFLQFPWRLLGPLAGCLAILAGLAFTSFEERLDQRKCTWLIGALLVVVLLLAVPLTYPADWPTDFGRTDLQGLVEEERNGRWLGTTSTGDYVPAGVMTVPKANRQVVDSLISGERIDRVNHATVPEGTTVLQTEDRPLRWVYEIDGEREFVFRLFHFDFPGWTATLDGQPAEIELANPDGFMTVTIPSGRHTLELKFVDTPARSTSWAVSAAALVLCLFLVTRRSAGIIVEPPSKPWNVYGYLILVPLLVLLFKLSLADPLGWFRRESGGMQVEGAQQSVFFQNGEEIALIGYDWQAAEPGQTAELVLYWKALLTPSSNYQVFVHLRDASGAVVAQSDKLNPGNYPAEWWPLDKYVRDPHRLAIPADLPAGKYRVAVGLWLMLDGTRLPVYDAAGEELGDSIFLFTLNY